MSKQTRHRYLFALVALLLCSGMGLPVVSGDDSIHFRYENEPLAQVLEKMSAESGFTIIVNGQGRNTPVSGEITNLQLEAALRKVLKRFNYTIVWDDTNKHIMISVYDGSSTDQPADLTTSSSKGQSPTRSPSYTIEPAGDRPSGPAGGRTSDTAPTDDPGTILSGEGRRFIQGTPTTGP